MLCWQMAGYWRCWFLLREGYGLLHFGCVYILSMIVFVFFNWVFLGMTVYVPLLRLIFVLLSCCRDGSVGRITNPSDGWQCFCWAVLLHTASKARPSSQISPRVHRLNWKTRFEVLTRWRLKKKKNERWMLKNVRESSRNYSRKRYGSASARIFFT